jgi:hypothetical protein
MYKMGGSKNVKEPNEKVFYNISKDQSWKNG